jgi:hypothetical protein
MNFYFLIDKLRKLFLNKKYKKLLKIIFLIKSVLKRYGLNRHFLLPLCQKNQKNGNFLYKKVVSCGKKWEKYVLLN